MQRPRLPRLALVLPWLLLASPVFPPPASGDDAPAHEAVRFARDVSLSSDGRALFFAWRGDVWTCSSSGGGARRLTAHPAQDDDPFVSPDGRYLAFVSNRSGSDQVWVQPLEGGAPRQVTTHTEGYVLYGFTPDGRALLVGHAEDHFWRNAARLYLQPLDASIPPTLCFDDYAYDASLSPDGRRIAFVREGVHWARKGYRGSMAAQVWVFDVEAGTFTRISQGDHGERSPRWTADGLSLYLLSEESGTWNVVRHELASARREPVTHLEGDGALTLAVSSDGSLIVFRHLDATWRLAPGTDVGPHALEISNGGDATAVDEERRVVQKAAQAAFTTDAREIVIAAGGDLWVMDTELRDPVRLTNTACEERDPVFSPDGQAVYFVRDEGRRPDIWKATRHDATRWWWQNERFELTRVTDDEADERGLTLTPDGQRLAFVHGNGDLVTMRPDGQDRVVLASSFAAPDWSFSPDGRWVAYAIEDSDFNRDVWIRRTDGSGEAVNVSRHPDDDGEPAFSPDGRLLAFTGRRWNDERDICYVWLRQEDEDLTKRDRTLEKAIEAMKARKGKGLAPTPAPKVEPPPPTQAPPWQALVGRWTGRVRGDTLAPEGLSLTLTLEARDGALHGTLAVGDAFTVPVEIPAPGADGTLTLDLATPLGSLHVRGRVEGDTLTGTWSLEDGSTGGFDARRDEQTASPSSEGPAATRAEGAQPAEKKPPSAPPPVEIDLEGISDRLHRISIANSEERGLLWSPDSKRLAFEATVDGQAGTYTVSIPDDLKPKRLSTVRGRGGAWLPDAKAIAWLVDGVPGTLDGGGKVQRFPFRARQVVDVGARNAAAFDLAWRTMRDTWYDPRLNHLDWAAVHAKYHPLAAAARTPEELEAAIDMMLGELNGSHVGFSPQRDVWQAPGWRVETAHLGLRFDAAWAGPGLRVRDVLPQMPADRSAHRVVAGEVVLAIDGEEVGPHVPLAALLTGDPDREVELRVRAADGQERVVRLRPSSYGAARSALYDAWIRHNEELVARQGQGRLGYFHVRSMNWASFQAFEEALYRVGHGRDGLVIDVRENGGGFTADYLLTCLFQPPHAFTVPRGGSPGYPQDRRVYAVWSKPIAVLVNQNSFSNAEIFAHAVKTLGRGPLVGVATAGGVISTGGADLMGVGSLRLPFRGWFLPDSGEDMERLGCVPDHVVWPTPGELPAGIDVQLEKAIEVVLAGVAEAEARPAVEPRYAADR